MGNDELSDQLKIFKLIEKKSGFKTTGSGPEMRLQLQSLIFEKFGAKANDLADGDSGVDGRRTAAASGGERRRALGGGGKGGASKKRKRTNIVSLHGWEWEANEEFIIERLIGKMVADGGEVPGHEGKKIPAGTILYKVLWEGFPPEIATWEEEDSIPCGEVDFVAQYEDGLDAEEQEAAEATPRAEEDVTDEED